VGLGGESGHERMPKCGHAIRLLVASIFNKLRVEFAGLNTQFNIKAVSESWVEIRVRIARIKARFGFVCVWVSKS